jgi:hypothetical protein
MTPFDMRRLAFGFLGLAVFVIAAALFFFIPSGPKAEAPKAEVSDVRAPDASVDWTTVTERYAARVDRVDVAFEQKDYTRYRLTTNGLVREGELNTERGFEEDPDATVYVLNWRKPEGEQIYYVRLTAEPDRIYVLDGDRRIIRGGALVRTP